jgi:glycosyltransferase involved in cell wall biosynthesis
MPAATVIIPTHNHVAPLALSIGSVLEQSFQDFELFVVGDGVGDATRALVTNMAASDSRIRFFDFAKGPRKGESHRHQALAHAGGRFVAYLGDDDYWMPNHLATLDALLSDADFGHTMHIGVDAQGALFAISADLENPQLRRRMLTELHSRFDLTFGGHTLEAYRRLPYGWRTTPADFPFTDLYMWRQFLAQPWCRAKSAMIPTAICTQTHRRPNLTDCERGEDLAHWRTEIARPDFREQLWRTITESFAREAIRNELAAYGYVEWALRKLLHSAERVTGFKLKRRI